MSAVGIDAVRSFIRTRLAGDNGAGGLFESGGTYSVGGIFETTDRDEGSWPRILMSVTGASLDGASEVTLFNVTLTVETDWNGNLEDRGLNVAHGIINRIRARLDGFSGTATDSATTTWRFSPIDRVRGSQSGSPRIGSQRNAVSDTYIVVGTTAATAVRVRSESAITSTGITSTMGLNPNGWTLSRRVSMHDVTPVGLSGISGTKDFEKKMATGKGSYDLVYDGQNLGITPSLPTATDTLRVTVGTGDYYESTDAVFGEFSLSSGGTNGPADVRGAAHLNPAVGVTNG